MSSTFLYYTSSPDVTVRNIVLRPGSRFIWASWFELNKPIAYKGYLSIHWRASRYKLESLDFETESLV